jgi:hypothetical protein
MTGIRSAQIGALVILAIVFFFYEKRLSIGLAMDKGDTQNG